MVVALRVQRAVYQQMGVMGLQRLALLARLAFDHWRAQHQVGRHIGRLRVVKGQHVGRVVLAPVVVVQRLAFLGLDDAHRDFGVALQRMANPAGYAVAR